jgi:hypothetical protein
MANDAAARDTTIDAAGDLRVLFHRLNNQLSVVLANAELLERRAADDLARARAGQVVTSTIEAMTTTRQLRAALEPAGDRALE